MEKQHICGCTRLACSDWSSKPKKRSKATIGHSKTCYSLCTTSIAATPDNKHEASSSWLKGSIRCKFEFMSQQKAMMSLAVLVAGFPQPRGILVRHVAQWR